ncbi:hypothetical protein HU200_000604 [Digitaria exilis]|uniref:Uncharacterized protein n=1 Tax=Digitaria exilis TaxID=1010633 RepID=A0A835G050_9POAL|nr:hypothetical protein HU200_000604 [Digitaria exilis]
MMSPPWNKILRALPPFVVIRSNHDGGPGRSLDQVLFFFGGRSKMGRNTRKKIMLNSAYRNVGRHSLGCGTTSG